PFAADQPLQQATMNLLADMGVQPSVERAINNRLTPASKSTDVASPISAAPTANGQTVSVGRPLVLSGAVQERGNGVVAGVEVSTDGTTWPPASGSTDNSWNYIWRPSKVGVAGVRVRATDDSGNIESPAAATGISVGPRPSHALLFYNSAASA